MAQGVLPFQYEAEKCSGGLTGFAGLGVYLELMKVSGLPAAVRRHIGAAGRQGWLDVQMVMALMALNLCGGDRVEDLERLEADEGFAEVLREVEKGLLSRRERREMKSRFRRGRGRALPSPSALSAWLERFHDAAEEAKRAPGRAFIPRPSAPLRGLWRVNQALLSFLQRHRRESVATLDMDATLVETHKRQALYCYKHFKAYQPLNTWWAEQGVFVHSEFRDGNVPAGHQQLRVFREALAGLPGGVRKVCLRSDTAAYQQDLLLYCGEGKDGRFGVIEFAVGADVTEEFRRAVLALPEAEWHPLYRSFEGQRHETDQEWAEVCFVPKWAGHSKKRADYRFLAIREPLRQLDLGDADQLPFPTAEFAAKGRYKLFGVVTNRALPGDEVIWWLRERCGKSEEAHAVMKDDLAGGTLPSGLFGANAAWWAIMVLAHNLNAAMKRLVLGPAWVAKRMKAIRFALIALPGRVMRRSRRLIIRLARDHPGLDLLLAARRTILALPRGPT
ncbi:MAG: IS1380 family transposase [Kiloniellaceae bacterium]